MAAGADYPFGLTGWRWVIIFGALCSLIIWVIRKKLPESARWLDEKGRHEEAHKVMCEMEQRCGVSPSPRHQVERQDNPRRLGSFKAIWAPQYRKRTIMLMVMNFFQAIGFFGFGNWLPALLSGQGRASPTACCMRSLLPSPIRLAVCSAPASFIVLKTNGKLCFPR